MMYVPMPVNKDGNGPEMDDNLVVKIIHEVWDWDCLVIAVFEDEEQARDFVERNG